MAGLIKKSKAKFNSFNKEGKTTFVQNNGISILDVILFNTDIKIKYLHVTTFRISKKDIYILIALKDQNYIEDYELLISDSIRQMVVGSYNHLKNNNIKFKELNTHTKMAFIEKENGDLVNVFSSGNFNPDGKIEFTSVDYNKETFYNFTNWIKSL
ncbi:MAG TPA: hypothetical protein DCS19_01260 [Flavobacterium sp.]|nr:hypothetical protein [Flavobacterium sp.]